MADEKDLRLARELQQALDGPWAQTEVGHALIVNCLSAARTDALTTERDRAARLESALQEAQDVARRDLERLAGVVDQRDRLEARLKGLLTRILRDGENYIDGAGIDRACQDADEIVVSMLGAEDERAQLEAWKEGAMQVMNAHDAVLRPLAERMGVPLGEDVIEGVRQLEARVGEMEAERDAWKQSYEDACAIADRISADVAAAEAEIERLRRDLGVDR